MLLILGAIGGVLLLRRKDIASHFYETRGRPYEFGSETGFRVAFIAFAGYLVALPALDLTLTISFEPLWFLGACTAFAATVNSHRNTALALDASSKDHLRTLQQAHLWMTSFASVLCALGSVGLFGSR